MGATLKTLDAIVDADGTIRFRQPVRLSGPAAAVVTILLHDNEPNETTRHAMEEPLDGLPRFENVDALFRELDS